MEASHDLHQQVEEKTYGRTVFGFWLYILSDFILFATLFSIFYVLRTKTFGGPTPRDIFDLPYSLLQSYLLLTCAFTSGIAGVFSHRGNRKWTSIFFTITAVLGILFLTFETLEFKQLLDEGGKWNASAFMSGFFTLVGTHTAHIIFAILWVPINLYLMYRDGITLSVLQKLTALRMFWQFLNVIWTFIFIVVYLMGVI
jgi:cytochrome o ubiquinol oxidase subunit 3